MNQLKAFLVALQFLTILPVRFEKAPDAETTGCSLVYYPLVGGLIGLGLTTLGWFGGNLPTNIHAGIMLLVWVGLTGALHLDGLADTTDAWVGGLGDRTKTLAIMKDPYCGPMGVVSIVLVLLLKFVALQHLIVSQDWLALSFAPMLSRTGLVLLFLTTPYVRSNGLGSTLAANIPVRTSVVIILLTLALIISLSGFSGCLLILVFSGLYFALRISMMRRIGGTTGDTAGAMVEINETILLLAGVLMV